MNFFIEQQPLTTPGRYFVLTAVALLWLAPLRGTGADAGDVTMAISSVGISRVKLVENSARVAGAPPDNSSEFIRIEVEYTITGSAAATSGARYAKAPSAWLDTCTFSWRVLFICSATPNGRLTPDASVMMSREVTYHDIELSPPNRLRKRHAVIYVAPTIYRRYGDNLAKDGIVAELIVKGAGQTLAQSWATSKNLALTAADANALFPGGNSRSWLGATGIQAISHGLLTRLETPWAGSSYGYYEFISPQ